MIIEIALLVVEISIHRKSVLSLIGINDGSYTEMSRNRSRP